MLNPSLWNAVLTYIELFEDIFKYLKISSNMKRDFYLDVYTILNRDLINNMDHMRISGNEPSSVILGQTK